MTLIIDGYNLLNASAVFAQGRGPVTLERSRHALLDFLVDHLNHEELHETHVVFDAKDAPPGRPRRDEHRGIAVHYAAEYKEADDLIEELIRADSAPRRLTVVSSDHRLQRAARRRRAAAVDSEVWLRQLAARRRRQDSAPDAAGGKPAVPPSPSEVIAWLREFGDLAPDDVRPETSADARPAMKESGDVGDLEGLANPFPPGYGEDVIDDDPPKAPPPRRFRK